MLLDDRARTLATEFACQWLDVRDFDKLDEKSERHFPTFTALRGDMYEESVRFFADLFMGDRSVLERPTPITHSSMARWPSSMAFPA